MSVDIDLLEILAKKATQTRWHGVGSMVEVEDNNMADICSCHPIDFDQNRLGRSYKESCSNASFIAECNPIAILELINSLRDTEKERDELKAIIDSGIRMYAFNDAGLQAIHCWSDESNYVPNATLLLDEGFEL